MSGPTGKHIPIRTVEDFLALPPDRRAVALREFAEWCRIHDEAGPVAAALTELGLRLTTTRDVFEWIDDDKGMIHSTVNFSSPMPHVPDDAEEPT